MGRGCFHGHREAAGPIRPRALLLALQNPGILPGMKTPIEIFRAGRHTPMSGAAIDFSEADIAEIAQSYDPARHEAPVVVGHPTADAPAYGWVKGLSAEGGHLFADFGQVDPAFSELVDAGRYKKVSASLYGRQSPHNPTPGKYHLKHVGFLGAVPPAVKGLKQISFAEEADALEFGEEDAAPETPQEKPAETSPAEALPKEEVPAQPSDEPEQPSDDPAKDAESVEEPKADDAKAAELSAREAALAEREKELLAREKAVAEAEAARKASENAAFAEGLVRQGRLLPRDRAGVAALLGALPEGELSFAEGGTTVKQSPAALLRSLLSRMPVQVDFSERAPAPDADAPTTPQGIHDAALAFQESERAAGREITFEDAVFRVAEGGKR